MIKKPRWKPSEEEMSILYRLCYLKSCDLTNEEDSALIKLYQDLKREFFGGKSFENMFTDDKSN